MRLLSVVLLAASTLVASAQQAAPTLPSNAPSLTKEEALHIRALNAESAAYDLGARQQIADTAQRVAKENEQHQQALGEERQQLVEQINKSHPGWHWVNDRSEATGHFEKNPPANPAEAAKK